jgi:hypothetical protein
METSDILGLTEAAKLMEALGICKAFGPRGNVNGPNCQRFGHRDNASGRWWWSVSELVAEARRRGAAEELIESVQIQLGNSVNTVLAESKSPEADADGVEKPWFWEGIVQSAVVEYLRRAGYQIRSFANTASRQQGKDVIAVAPTGKTLWISAKGYPVGSAKTPAPTQARHWFADALFDLILWHGEDDSVSLGLALPKQETYRKLVARTDWFLSTVRNCIYWVDQDGSVIDENCYPAISERRNGPSPAPILGEK